MYIGITNDLIRRVAEHKDNKIKGFTSKYKVDRLVWYEDCTDAVRAIEREKQLKKWNRKWKLALIEQLNPEWHDLYDEFMDSLDSRSSRE